MIRTLAAVLATSTCIVALATPAAAQTREYNIPAGSLKSALDAYVRQSGQQVVYRTDEVRSARSPGVRGPQSADAALAALLSGSGFATRIDGKLVAIVRASGNAENGDEITVTGTRLRGGVSTSPVTMVTQAEMRNAGHNNLGEAMRALPQNFSGGQNPGVAIGAGAIANQNITGSSGLNLRGLGPDATLTLLNGNRLPFDGFTQATDVTSIPAGAIDRIEILLDGASAIYGADAVAGVANVILRRDFSGAEVSARYGLATDGGYEQQQYSGVAGHRWGSGGFLIAGDLTQSTPIKARQRDYLSHLSFYAPTEIYPDANQKSAMLSAHQALGQSAQLSADAFYSNRSGGYSFPATLAIATAYEFRSEIWGVAPSLRVDLSGGWDMRLHGAIGRNVADGRQSYSSITTGAAAGTSNVRYINESKSAGLEAEGVLLRLPGGDARLSIGGGWRDNQYQQRNLISGAVLTGGAQRVFYGYGELGVPLVGDEMAVPYVHRLTLNLSGRYEAYDSFGDTATPKVGLLWSPVSGLDVRASWGRSFKAPTLSQQFQQQGIYLYPSTTLGGAAAGAPAGVPTLLLSGGNPDLSPERAETLALGFSVTPALIANTTFEFNWFHIDYRARIVSPISIFGQALSNPANSASVTSSPNVDEIRAAFARVGRAEGSFTGNFAGVPYNPANIFAIVDNLFTNTASDKLSGIDVAASHKVGLFDGDLVLRASGSWIINSKRRVTPLSPETLTAGQIYTPARFRGLAGLSWSSDGLILSSNVNHISGVLDTNQTPNVRTGAMTTADFVLDYSFEASGWGNLGFSISVMNLFNAKPPLIASGQPVYVNYDSTNYSALGRVINATIRARF